MQNNADKIPHWQRANYEWPTPELNEQGIGIKCSSKSFKVPWEAENKERGGGRLSLESGNSEGRE